MDLSVIIVNYKGWTPLRDCLDSIVNISGEKLSMEIIVVDNRSDDGKIDQFEKEYPGVIFLRNDKNAGFANGNNMGTASATGNYFLFLNPDTVASAESVRRLYEEIIQIKHPALISCKQYNRNGKESRAYGIFPGPGTLTGTGRSLYKLLFRKSYESHFPERDGIVYPDWVSGSVMITSRATFISAGRFDEDFWMYYEDTDLCRRIRNMGGEIRYYTGFGIMHNHGGSSRINSRTSALTKTEVLISRHVYISKHFRGLARYCIQAFLVLNNLISGLLTSAAGLLLVFRPRIFINVRKFGRLIEYYCCAAIRRRWISPRSVRYNKKIRLKTN